MKRIFIFWFKSIDCNRFSLFIKVFAFVFLIYILGHSLNISEWLGDKGFHVTTETKNSHQLDPLPLLNRYLVFPFIALMIVSCLMVIFNYYQRFVIWIVLLGSIYLQNFDPFNSFTLNKLFVFFFALIAFSPKPKKLEDGKILQSAWPLRIAQSTLIILYFTAGTCKIFQGDWLIYSDILWAQSQGVYCTEITAFMLRNLPKFGWVVLGYFVLIFELFSPILFSIKKIRTITIIVGVSFHIAISFMMSHLIYFSIQMISFYIVFLSEEQCENLLEKIKLRVSKMRLFKNKKLV